VRRAWRTLLIPSATRACGTHPEREAVQLEPLMGCTTNVRCRCAAATVTKRATRRCCCSERAVASASCLTVLSERWVPALNRLFLGSGVPAAAPIPRHRCPHTRWKAYTCEAMDQQPLTVEGPCGSPKVIRWRWFHSLHQNRNRESSWVWRAHPKTASFDALGSN